MTQSLHHRLSLTTESTFGTTPTTPTMLLLEGGPTSPSYDAPKQVSDTIRNDGNVKSTVPLNRSGSFSRSQELVYPTYNEGLWTEIRSGLRTTEAAAISSGTNGATSTDTLACTGGAATITRSSGSFVSDGYQPGDIIKLSNAAAADNGYYKVVTVAALTLTVQIPDGGTFTTDTDVDIARGARMVNGTTDYSHAIEEAWLDSTASYPMVVWTGQKVDSLEFGFQIGSKSTISIGYVGRDGLPTTMSSGGSNPPVGISSASYMPYTESPVIGPTNAIRAVINGATLPLRSMSVTTRVGARLRHSNESGAVPDAVPTGAFRCNVSVSGYASVLSLLTQHRAGTAVPVWVVMEDANGKAIAVSLGTVRWDSASLPTGGPDEDAIISATGTATLTPAVDANDQNWTMRFLRFD